MAELMYIKNMVCPRCIESIRQTLVDAGIEFEQVELGEVHLKNSLEPAQHARFKELIQRQGFELLEDETSATVASIKALIIDQIHYSKESLKVNFSTYLANKLNKDYTYLSRLFSSVESVTIEKFITSQKIERVKELLIYDQLTLSQIAHQMHYSSVAHLSSQFKKETGFTPSEFKKQANPKRTSLDQL